MSTKKKYNNTFFLTAIFLLIAVFAFSQSKYLKKIESNFESLNFNERELELLGLDISKLNPKEKGNYFYLLGRTYYLSTNSSEALINYLKAKDVYIKIGDYSRLTSINLDIVELKRISGYSYDKYKYLLEEAVEFSKKNNDINLLCDTYLEIGSSLIESETKRAIEYYKLAISENKKTNNQLFEAKLFQNIGIAYGEHLHDLKEANFYYNKALKVFKEKNKPELIAYVYIGKASLFRQKKSMTKPFCYTKRLIQLV